MISANQSSGKYNARTCDLPNSFFPWRWPSLHMKNRRLNLELHYRFNICVHMCVNIQNHITIPHKTHKTFWFFSGHLRRGLTRLPLFLLVYKYKSWIMQLVHCLIIGKLWLESFHRRYSTKHQFVLLFCLRSRPCEAGIAQRYLKGPWFRLSIFFCSCCYYTTAYWSTVFRRDSIIFERTAMHLIVGKNRLHL